MPEKKDTCGDCMKFRSTQCRHIGSTVRLSEPCELFTPKVKAEPDFAGIAKKVNEQIQQERKQAIPTGWLCTRCGRINSPWTVQCPCPPVPPWSRPYEIVRGPTCTSDPLPPGTVVM